MADRQSKTRRRAAPSLLELAEGGQATSPAPKPRPVDALFGNSPNPSTGSFVVEAPRPVTTVAPPPLDLTPISRPAPRAFGPEPASSWPDRSSYGSIPAFALEPAGEPEEAEPTDVGAAPVIHWPSISEYYQNGEEEEPDGHRAGSEYAQEPEEDSAEIPTYTDYAGESIRPANPAPSEYRGRTEEPTYADRYPKPTYDDMAPASRSTINQEPPPSSYFYESAPSLNQEPTAGPGGARSSFGSSTRFVPRSGISSYSPSGGNRLASFTRPLSGARPVGSSSEARGTSHKTSWSFAAPPPPSIGAPTTTPVPAPATSNVPVSMPGEVGTRRIPSPMPAGDPQDYAADLPTRINQLYNQVTIQLVDSSSASEYCNKLLLQARQAVENRDYASAEFYAQSVEVKLKRSARSMQIGASPTIVLLWIWQIIMLLLGAAVVAVTYITDLMLFGMTVSPEFIVLLRSVGWGGIGGVVGSLYNMPWFLQYREYDPAYNLNYFTRPVQGLLMGGIIFLISQAGIFAGSIILPGIAGANATTMPVGPIFLYVLAALAGFKQEYVYEFFDNILRTVFRIPRLPNELQPPTLQPGFSATRVTMR